MYYSFNVLDWAALAPGLSITEDWCQWARETTHYQWHTQELAKFQKIPMMVARRMSIPSKVAVETALWLVERNLDIDAAVFVSRHGEVERTYNIVSDLANQKDISPTGFAMSVHNTAAGLFTIEAKKSIPVSSLSAGIDGFHQGLLEVQGMFASGKKKVMLIDFDGVIPTIYHSKVTHYQNGLIYAVGLVITKGDTFCCNSSARQQTDSDVLLPQALTFLRHYLLKSSSFVIQGARNNWQWQLQHA